MPSNYVGARSIEELAASLQKMAYTPRTDEERRRQSESLYQAQLEQGLLSAQQNYDTSSLALQNQLNGLNTSAQRQIEAQRENTQRSISAADRQALSRGMQRSSYNNATLANIRLKGNEAEQQIEQNRTDTENSIAAQQALLAQQLAQNQASARSQFEANVTANMVKMADEDYQRQVAAEQNNTATQLQLYQLLQNDLTREAKYAAGAGGGGSGGYTPKKKKTTDQTTDPKKIAGALADIAAKAKDGLLSPTVVRDYSRVPGPGSLPSAPNTREKRTVSRTY
jgi:hypothetical protein